MIHIPCSYPSALFEDLLEMTRLPAGARVLEIGAGIGEATLPLAERGFRITALELSPELAEIARGRLAAYAGVEIIVSDFETWAAPEEPFDLILSATAMQEWEEEVRFKKPASLLRPGGHFAIVRYLHARGEDESFFLNALRYYQTLIREPLKPSLVRGRELRCEEMQEWADCGYFQTPASRTYFAEDAYGRDEYLALLATYSDHRRLPPDTRETLFECIGTLMDYGYDGTIRKCSRSELFLVQRVEYPA